METAQTYLSELAWQVEIGADEAVGETAGFLHWDFSPKAPAQRLVETPKGLSASKTPIFIHTVRSAEQATPLPVEVKSTSLDALKCEIEAYDACPLKHMAMNTVFAAGNPAASVMVLGDVPGEQEDRQGYPFVGPEGALLDKMLAAIGLDRGSVYLSNMVFWRPPGNRTPSEVELAACLPFVRQHIELVKPRLLLLFGSVTVKALLHRKESFAKIRGQWLSYEGGEKAGADIPCLATYHPAYLLKQPAFKRHVWADLLTFKEKLDSLDGSLSD